MATTDIKNLEKLIKEILAKIEGVNTKASDEIYNKTLDKINSKLESIDENFASKSEKLIKEIQSEFEKCQKNEENPSETNTEISENIKDFVSIITNEMIELKEQFDKFNTEYTDLSINTSMVASKEILSLKNSVLSLNDTIEAIKNKIECYDIKKEIVPEISQNVSKNFADVIESYLNNFKTDAFALLAKISDSISTILENAKAFNNIETSIEEIIQTQQKNKEEILKILTNNIANENKKLLPQILQMVNSISFDDIAEEIKDGLFAVNENLGIVNKNIEKGSISTEKNISTLNTKVENLAQDISRSEMLNKVSKIDAVLDSISTEFNVLTKGSRLDTGEYFYTLLDLESDISKVRIILDNLNNSVQDDRSLAESITKSLSEKISNINSFIEKTSKLYADADYKTILNQFETLNDDITSISRRTNKLILTSDDSATKLQKNIEDFQDMISKIYKSIESLEKSSMLKTLIDRTNSLQKFMNATVQSNNAINEAFIYLAGWIDNTSEEIKSIQETLFAIKQISYEKNFDNIENYFNTLNKLVFEAKETNQQVIKESIDNLNKNLADNISANNNCNNTNNTEILLNETNKRIDTIENKLDTLINKINSINTQNTKIDRIEEKLQKLLSYVEDDEEE